ncbi:MAG: PSD1 and planctomycete cytochrome C domain-containing protein [Pirellulaceae bacterium]
MSRHSCNSYRAGSLRTICSSLAAMASCLWVSIFSFAPLVSAQQPTPDFVQTEFTASDLEFFEKQVRPLLLARCLECHSQDEQSGGLSLESRSQILAGGDSGPAVDLENLDNSLLLKAIQYSQEELQMPPDNKLPEAEIETLTQWVQRRLPDPRLATLAAESTSPTGMSVEDGRNFWAFQPVSKSPLPAVESAAWIQTPVDAFVLRQLEVRNLQPAPRADEATLIRRLSFDLTGLPPTPDEVHQFVHDSSPHAYAALVERLLASPQYGVRWGRHWLDVARYADSNGLDENIAYGNAWRYRDYVIQAFNQDKPYHHFVLEQLAGDLLPYANQQTQTATGFLALGAKVLAEPDMDKLVMDTIDEQIDSTGKAFMGLSLGCARCHDHKFDPISQQDYYALAAIFKGTRTFSDERFGAIKYWYEHSFTSPPEQEQLTQVNAKIAAAKNEANQFKAAAMAKIRQQAEQHAAEYLAAAAKFSPQDSLADVATIAEQHGLHARILFHCRSHIENQQHHPFYSTWHQSSQDPNRIRQHYAGLFAQVDTAWQTALQANPQTDHLVDDALELVRQERLNRAGFLVVPPQPEFAFDDKTLSEYHRLLEDARILESSAMDASAAMGVCDGLPCESIRVHIRGSHLNLGEPVERNFPAVMRPDSQANTIFPQHQSGRLELAQWLASTSHPLTARVMVNRIWGWHFGQPLVTTTENFGVLGQRPSHPELLDWLAHHFMQSGWSIKQLHRQIVHSNTYQMASSHPHSATADAADAENRLLWKFPLQRMDAEQIRDSVLAVSNRLNLQLGGKTVPLRNRQFVFDHTSIDHTRYDSVRRTAYLPIIRNNLYSLFEQFDFPDPTMATGQRHTTTVAPQSLLMLNSDLMLQSAESLSQYLLTNFDNDSPRIEQLFQRLFARNATDTELQMCQRFLHEQTRMGLINATTVDGTVEQQAWTLLTQSLLATNDFLYIR